MTQCDGLALSSVTSHFSNNSFIPKRTILIYTAKISGIKLWCKITTSKKALFSNRTFKKKFFFSLLPYPPETNLKDFLINIKKQLKINKQFLFDFGFEPYL